MAGDLGGRAAAATGAVAASLVTVDPRLRGEQDIVLDVGEAAELNTQVPG